MEIDYELVKDIILIAIPTGVGALTSKLVTNSWQIRNDKIKMKAEVIDAFRNSAKLTFNLQYGFVYRIVLRYGDVLDFDNMPQTGNIEFKVNFPTSREEQPHQQFHKEFEKVELDLIQTRLNGSNFISLLRLYYRDEKLLDEYRILRRHTGQLWFIANKILNADSVQTFVAAVKEYESKQHEVRNLTRELEQKLIDTKLHKIPV